MQYESNHQNIHNDHSLPNNVVESKPHDQHNHSRISRNINARKKKRRLKKKVKYRLYLLLVILMIAILRPWQWVVEKANSTITTDSVQTQSITPLNMLISNTHSDLPESEKFDRSVNRFINKWEINGASLAIMKDGCLIYSKGYGYADVENKTPVDVRHLFRIASLSKLITAVGIMKLEEQGKLSLDSRVFGESGILPNYKNYTDKRINNITIDQLLRHRGGFTVRSGDPMFSPRTMQIAKEIGSVSAPSTDQIIEYCLGSGLGYTPGNNTKYSNLGYVILSQIIEKISGIDYEQYIKDSILAPAGCYDMHMAKNTDSLRRSNEVKYYESSDAENVLSCNGSEAMVPKTNGGNNVEGLLGAGGWIASPVELLLFTSSIDGDPSKPDILKPETIRKMTEYSKSTLPIGWMKVSPKGDWIRTGSMAGTSALLRKQNNGYTWVFVTNTSSWKGSKFPNYINQMLQTAFRRVDSWPERDMFDSITEECEYEI